MSQPLRTLRILLVDSDPQALDKIQQALGAGFIFHCVHSLDEARRSLEEKSLPDMVISEMVFPNASGLDLCRMVRHSAAWQHLPVMLLTNLSTLQDKVAGFEAGADDFVVKPFDARHLTARIRLLSRIKHLEFNR